MNANKKKLYIEYPLATKSHNIVWEQIGTIHGLGRWLADRIDELGDNVIALTWGQEWGDHHTLEARIVECRKNDRIRLQWLNEEDPDAFWGMRIGKSELTGELCLCVDDYALAEDVDDLHDLWDGNMERLHRVSGV